MPGYGKKQKQRSLMDRYPSQFTVHGIDRQTGGTPDQAVNRTNKFDKAGRSDLEHDAPEVMRHKKQDRRMDDRKELENVERYRQYDKRRKRGA